MAKFVLVQPALRDVGGHYYDFAARILPEVEAAGYQPVLAVHRDCLRPDWIPGSWGLVPVFRRAESRMRPPRRRWSDHDVIDAEKAIGDVPAVSPGNPGSRWSTFALCVPGIMKIRLLRGIAQWHDRIGDWLRARRWHARIAEFQESCRELFTSVPLAAGDHVLFASAGDLDLAGFGKYLQSAAIPANVQWSFLFHYSLLEGREADYPRQSARLDMLRAHYRQVFDSLKGCDLKLYATTSRLASQFDHLGIGKFESIRYPVNSVFRPYGTVTETAQKTVRGDLASSGAVPAGAEGQGRIVIPQTVRADRPRRVICAGGIRREKGSHVITRLVEQLDTCLSRGAVQLLVQSEDTKKAAKVLSLADNQTVERCVGYSGVRAAKAPVVLVPHPLKPSEYIELIRNADVGLFLYDDKAYYARASGILLELLSCGLPAIVPAGCWLSELLFEPTQQYLEEVARTATTLNVLRWDAPGVRFVRNAQRSHPMQGIGREGHPDERECRFTVSVPEGTRDLLVTFQLHDPVEATWTRAAIEWEDVTCASRTTVIGGDGSSKPIRVLQPAVANGRVTVKLSDAYRDAPLPLQGLEIRCLAPAVEYPEGRPSGAAGLTAVDLPQVPQLLEELLLHYTHYRASAARYAGLLADRHSPRQTARQFLRLPRDLPTEMSNITSCFVSAASTASAIASPTASRRV